MSLELPLHPCQWRALRRSGRELLVKAEPSSGASHWIRAAAIYRAAEVPGLVVVIAVPDAAKIRAEWLDGPGRLWDLLRPWIAAGDAKVLPGGSIALANGSLIQVLDWKHAERRAAHVLFVDDADGLGWGSYRQMRETVLSTAPIAAAFPRLTVVSRAGAESWADQHWASLSESEGVAARLRAAEIPEAQRRTVETVKPLSFREYASRVRPGLAWRYHTELIAEEVLQPVIERELLRVLIFAPPRYGKSELVSRLLPAYQLYRAPDDWVGLGTATAPLGREMSKDARGYYREGGGVVREDSNDASLWRTTFGGGMWARGVGGTILGIGFNLGIVDDPFSSREAAMSPRVQETVLAWYNADFYSRRQLENVGAGVAIVVMHQRLDESDLAGRLLKAEETKPVPEEWTILNLPAVKRPREYAFPETCDVIEDDREEGEPLAPELQTAEELEALRLNDPLMFDTIYQQEPKPTAGGGMFKRHWWPVLGAPEVLAEVSELAGLGRTTADVERGAGLSVRLALLQKREVLPEFWREVRSWDFAATEGGKAATVGVRGGIAGEHASEGKPSTIQMVWTDVVEEYIDEAKVKGLILETAKADGVEVEVVIPREPGAAGKILVGDLERALRLLGVTVVVADSSKAKRLRAMGHAGAAVPREHVNPATGEKSETPGLCSILRAPWNDRFCEQHHRFDGKTGEMDIVDATAQAFNELNSGTRPYLGWSR